MDLKKESARVAYSLVKADSAIGLGEGSSMLMLAAFFAEGIAQGLRVRLYTSSLSTSAFLQDAGIMVFDISQTDRLDLYFDGCDQVDHQLNALKSGAGIHTQEKLLASMARKFIVLADESKFVSVFSSQFPLVLEVLPQATQFVQRELKSIWPDVSLSVRLLPESQGPVLSRNGNWLIDCLFRQWPEPAQVHYQSKKITGVVEISLFHQLARLALIARETGVQQYELAGS